MPEVHRPNPAPITEAPAREDDYTHRYAESIRDPDAFWARVGQRLEWVTPPTIVKDTSFDLEDFHIHWYADGVLNASANCLDRHLAKRGDQPAIIFEGDDPADSRSLTYGQLHREVCQCANALQHIGVGQGDRVVIYMPMIPEAAIAMLACARLGAIHAVVFSGYSSDALADRITDLHAKIVITADEGLRAGRHIALKANVDHALQQPGTDGIEAVVVVRHTGAAVTMQAQRDYYYHALVGGESVDCPPVPVGAEHPLFVLYASGSTGRAKGAIHATGGYLVFASYTFETIFGVREGDVHWCTIDLGWIAGHSYALYGPLANGATTVMFEGTPRYPDYSRLWRIVDRYKVTIFYTSAAVIRALMRAGVEPVERASRASLRLLGTAGGPTTPDAREWFRRVVGESRCLVVDTWEQTEAGGILITPLPGRTDAKPGSVARPFFGICPAIVEDSGTVGDDECAGSLVITDSWPAQMRDIYGDHRYFIDTYFKIFPGYYFTGDGARRDADGNYWITGRVDDVINVSGHRIGIAEVEHALVTHPKVTAAAVVGRPDNTKGQGIYAYVVLTAGEVGSEVLRQELVARVCGEIGAFAGPDCIQWATGLPKGRSGKIDRHALRAISERCSQAPCPTS